VHINQAGNRLVQPPLLFFAMASEEDNFDIDIYGDGDGEMMGHDGTMDYKQEDEHGFATAAAGEEGGGDEEEEEEAPTLDSVLEESAVKADPEHKSASGPDDHAAGPGRRESADTSHTEPAKVERQQGTKRKETSDDRPIDTGATNALMISDLHWWTTEDDIRGWANEAGAEDELREVTFSEHKVNGKSKGFVAPPAVRSFPPLI